MPSPRTTERTIVDPLPANRKRKRGANPHLLPKLSPLEKLPTEVLRMICTAVPRPQRRVLRHVSRRLNAVAILDCFSLQSRGFLTNELLNLVLLLDSGHGQHMRELCLEESDHPPGTTLQTGFFNQIDMLDSACCLHYSLLNLRQLRCLRFDQYTFSRGWNHFSVLPRIYFDIFVAAFRGVELPLLTELDLGFEATDEFLADMLEECRAYDPIWWRGLCGRLRKLTYSRATDDGSAAYYECSSDASSLTGLLSETDNLQALSVHFDPSCAWPVGEVNLHKLESLDLNGAKPTAACLTALIRQNRETIREIRLVSCDLTSGYWESVLVCMKSCKQLQYFFSYRCSYSYARTNGAAFRGFQRQQEGLTPLDSVRWADWHALRDVSLVTKLLKPVDHFSIAAKVDAIIQGSQWADLKWQYRSLDDYKTMPLLALERESDARRERGGRTAHDWLPEGVEVSEFYRSKWGPPRPKRGKVIGATVCSVTGKISRLKTPTLVSSTKFEKDLEPVH